MNPSTRRKKERSSEEFYVGPSIDLTPAQTPPSDAPHVERGRKYKGIPYETGFREIRSEEITIEPGRVGGPSLCRLPVHADEDNRESSSRRAYENGLRAKVAKILDAEKVIYEDIALQRRTWYFDNHYTTDEESETVVVGCADNREDSKTWSSACMKIREFFIEQGLQDLNIEIASPMGITPLQSWEVEVEHPLRKIWRDIRVTIHELLRGKEWISLELFRRGKHYTLDNTCPVTIVVTIAEDSVSNWRFTAESIVLVTENYGMDDVAVEVSRGRIILHEDRALLGEGNWDQEAKSGHSIGPHGQIYHPSTLGGFLDLTFPSQRKTYGVTCFHCVAPATISNPSLSKWEKEGIFPDDRTNDLAMDQPSLGDHEESLRFYEKQRTQVDNEKHRSIRAMLENPEHPDSFVTPRDESNFHANEKIITRFDKLISSAREFIASGSHYLGTVYAASGKRRADYGQSKNVTCDWALIDVASHRMSRNYLPKPDDLPRAAKLLFSAASDVISGVGSAEFDQNVFKRGRSTGVTWGEYVGLQTSDIKSWKLQPDGTQKEIVGEDRRVLGKPSSIDNLFGEGGDSGSFIVNNRGQFIGIYWGGNTLTGASYFTGADALFEDIMHITGATSVDITE
ncbi:hypothetical protein MMC13_006319 [Lambiella insularis]|nr:hypothetical protein [Lambiella insularis]